VLARRPRGSRGSGASRAIEAAEHRRGIANEEDCQRSLGIAVEAESTRGDVVADAVDLGDYERLCAEVLEEFLNLRCQAITLRTSHSASHNEWSACLCNRREF
jgi:2-dehydro-3-deoxygluconokinase